MHTDYDHGTTRKMKWNSKMTQDSPSLSYHPVQSTLALTAKENRRLNKISKSIQRHLFQVALFKAVVLLRSFAENNQLHKQA
ncbi:hypothetical protein NPIL_352341 [Nephila pilipes]|uniref:Uncharacterized protein n=1 Tax=Nephila pilipes TaxID=299642 RepID=A0A8X6T4Z4_NEPPI|nr:hypothetical protein NPIL_352341 [Nephila pilipes]